MQKALIMAGLFLFGLLCGSNGISACSAAEIEIEVVAADTTGTLVVYGTNNNGKREELMRTEAYVGRNGCDTDKREGDGKTSVGVYEIRRGFGLNTPPAVSIDYTQLQGGEQWVDDVASARYNQWVTRDTTPCGLNSAEDLPSETEAYKYVAVIEYNTDNIVKGAGSAIFLHCSKGRPTSGCISVSEDAMVKILGLINPARALPLPAPMPS